MDNVNNQAALSAVRSLLAIAGGSLVTHGVVNETQWAEIVGALMTLGPIAWGVWDKYRSERKTVAREVIAVNAGVAMATGDTGGPPSVSAAQAPQVIKTYAPAPSTTTTEGPKP